MIYQLCGCRQVEPWKVTDAARAFIERKNSIGIMSTIWSGGDAADLQLWALGVVHRVERGCGTTQLIACVVFLAAVCLHVMAQL
jgi:hypothetical protein